jgi:uncharacterized protein
MVVREEGTSMAQESQLISTGHSLAAIAAALADRKLPPVDQWNPPYCGPIDMRIARDGTWYYLGSPIGRAAMVKLFSTVLRRDADGGYYLVTPVEKLGIQVDDAPFVAVEVLSEGAGRERSLGFRLNTDDHVLAGADHRIRVDIDPETQEPSPYIHVRGRLEALINRPVFYELVELAYQESGAMSDVLGLWSQGIFFELGRTTT